MNNKVIMHINYGEIEFNSFGKRSVDDICRMAADMGFDGIEFRGMLPKELEENGVSFEEYVAQVAAAKKKYGLNEILFSLLAFGCDSEDEAERKKVIADIIKKAQIVNNLCGTTLCNTVATMHFSTDPDAKRAEYEKHGSAVTTADQWNWTVEAYQQIGREADHNPEL